MRKVSKHKNCIIKHNYALALGGLIERVDNRALVDQPEERARCCLSHLCLCESVEPPERERKKKERKEMLEKKATWVARKLGTVSTSGTTVISISFLLSLSFGENWCPLPLTKPP